MAGDNPFETEEELKTAAVYLKSRGLSLQTDKTCVGSVLYANKPGDGSAREYAATCQRVIGGWANICREYATKRYRSNLINWGILPFTFQGVPCFKTGSLLWVPGIRRVLESGGNEAEAFVIPESREEKPEKITLSLGTLGETERRILLEGCLINYYKCGGR